MAKKVTKPSYDKETLGFEPSEYQKKFFDFVINGEGNAIIEAGAGCGKTSTLVAAMKLIPKKQKCKFIAFNKSIADELNNKISTLSNCNASTAHSLGYSMLTRNFDNRPELDEYKYRTYVKKHLGELSTIDSDEVQMTRTQIRDYIDTICVLVNMGRLNLAQTPKEMKAVAAMYDIPYEYDECEVAVKCLQWGKDNLDSIDYTDMVWLPVELGINPRGLQYDWLLVDECQDMSKLSIELVKKCFKRGTRAVFIGDKNQSIYSFAGSSPEAFQTMRDFPNTTKFELPVSYRCAKNIVKLANEYVPTLKAREGAPDGQFVRNCKLASIKDGDMVLARSKAPLFNLYTKLLKKGVNCYLKGKDIGRNLIERIEDINQVKLNPSLDADGVFVRLYDKMFTDRNKLMQSRGLDVYDASLSASIIEQYDMINALLLISNNLKYKKDLINKIDEIFADDGKGVCLSTIHKAKGLEATNVYILCRNSMPSKRATKDWEKRQESNLIYVAYTRAKEKLGFISDKELPPSGGQEDSMKIINDMMICERRICRILNKVPTNYDTNIEVAKFNAQNTPSIEAVETRENTVTYDTNDNDSNASDSLLSELEAILEKRNVQL